MKMRPSLNNSGDRKMFEAGGRRKLLPAAASILALAGGALVLLFSDDGGPGVRGNGLTSTYYTRRASTVECVDEETRRECATRRGSPGGHWIRDLEMAPLMQYTHKTGAMTSADRHHVPDPRHPHMTKYRSPTTYAWRDLPAIEDKCGGQVMPLNGEDFCKIVVDKLGLGRVMYVGDSLAEYQWHALLYQIGAEEPWYKTSIMYDCPPATKSPDGSNETKADDTESKAEASPEKRQVELVQVKNDWLLEVPSPLIPSSSTKPTDRLKPWKETYLSADTKMKTLLVVNTGAHFAGKEGVNNPRYAEVIDAFLTDVQNTFLRPDDVVVLRTTPGGHPSCLTADRPFESEDDRRATSDDDRFAQYGWKKYGVFDEYLRDAVGRYNDGTSYRGDGDSDGNGNGRGQGEGKGPNEIYLLDVAYMTYLRPDGHISGPDNLDPNKKPGDCLHYSLPGPIDWWNNLLFRNLADLPPAKMEKAKAEKAKSAGAGGASSSVA